MRAPSSKHVYRHSGNVWRTRSQAAWPAPASHLALTIEFNHFTADVQHNQASGRLARPTAAATTTLSLSCVDRAFDAGVLAL